VNIFSSSFFWILCVFVPLPPSEASPRYCAIPGDNPPGDPQNLLWAGEKPDSNRFTVRCATTEPSNENNGCLKIMSIDRIFFKDVALVSIL
jgi:hypothetical protein